MKVISVCVLSVLMSGCYMPHSDVDKATWKCNLIGGNTYVQKAPNGKAITVRCIVGDVTYGLGDY